MKTKNTNIFASISNELKMIEYHLVEELPSQVPPLKDMVKFVFSGKGKLLRPALAILSGHLTGGIKDKHFILAQLTELIHTASLVHDDLLDSATTRRGQEALHLKWGSKIAVIIGDFLFAQASVKLGELEHFEIVKIYAKVLADLCTGEINQAQNRFDLKTLNLENYLNKSVFKTASLFSASTKSGAMLNTQNEKTIQILFDYGHNLGIAFQIIDDLLDFTADEIVLGKPSLGDLRQGIFTAPILFALKKPEYKINLEKLLNENLENTENLQEIKQLLLASGAFEETFNFAQSFIQKAKSSLDSFGDNIYKKDLIQLAEFTLQRAY